MSDVFGALSDNNVDDHRAAVKKSGPGVFTEVKPVRCEPPAAQATGAFDDAGRKGARKIRIGEAIVTS
jgi:hypothetical protein